MSCPFSSRGAREKDAPKDAEGKIAPNLPSGVTPIGYHEYLKVQQGYHTIFFLHMLWYDTAA